MIVALFDSDGTLYSNQQGRGMLKYLDSHNQRSRSRIYYGSFVALRFLSKLKLLSAERFQQATTIRLGWLVKGWTEPEAAKMLDWVAREYLLPTKRTDTEQRLRDHQSRGHKVVIISAMFVPCLKRITEYFGVTDFIGTGLESKDGVYTGRIIPPLISGEVKAESARRFFSSHHLEVDWSSSYAYGDSSTDRNLLGLVGHPVAVHPDAGLFELAQSRNWEILGNRK